MRKNRKPIKATNAIEPATTTGKNWGFVPVPNKGGKTTNGEICDGKSNGTKGGAADA